MRVWLNLSGKSCGEGFPVGNGSGTTHSRVFVKVCRVLGVGEIFSGVRVIGVDAFRRGGWPNVSGEDLNPERVEKLYPGSVP
jgi:hypothetical protein